MTLKRGQSAGLISELFQPVIEFYGLYGFSGLVLGSGFRFLEVTFQNDDKPQTSTRQNQT